MANLIYSVIASLDGYIADEQGNFDWGVPDEEVHTFINDLQRGIGTYLYGRGLYEVMYAWETMDSLADQPEYIFEFAQIWQLADKIVYSKTLEKASSSRTRIEREFDPQAIQALKSSEDQDILVGGPNLAAHAFKAGLVDECHLILAPILIGGGKKALPSDFRLELTLMGDRRFNNGMIYLGYRTARW
jgi:dihydrofolate reductase